MVDDATAFRDGIRSILKLEPFVDSIYEAWDEASFMQAVNNYAIDIILLDFRLRGVNGLELFKKLKCSGKRPRVIAITEWYGPELAISLFKAGVDALVHKLDGYDGISEAMGNVLESESYFSEGVMKAVHDNQDRLDKIPSVLLTPKEKDFFKALAAGHTTKEIASLMEMTVGATEQFRIKLFRKFGVHNTPGLLAFAFRNGLL